MDIKRIVERTDTPAGRYFDLFVQAMIVVSLISFCIETLPGLSPTSQRILFIIEVVTVSIFTAEYILRIAVADHKFRHIFSFFGLIDLVAIAPFYFARAVDLRAIRIVRVLRIFRVLKIVRYSRAIQRFRMAFNEVRAELVVFLLATSMLIFIASVGIYYFERDAQPEAFASVFHSMWWSVVTLTTVGYGDVYPVTIGGRIFTGMVLLVGLALVSVPSGLLAAALTKTVNYQNEEESGDE